MTDISSLVRDTCAALCAAGYIAMYEPRTDWRDGFDIAVSGNGLAMPFNIRACTGYGAARNRVEFVAFPPSATSKGLHHSDYIGKLGETTVAIDATGKRAASQCLNRIIKPAHDLLAAYQAKIDKQASNAKACDAIDARLARYGLKRPERELTANDRASRQAVKAYKSFQTASGDMFSIDAECHADGRVTVNRLYLPASIDGIALLAEIVERVKGSN